MDVCISSQMRVTVSKLCARGVLCGATGGVWWTGVKCNGSQQGASPVEPTLSPPPLLPHLPPPTFPPPGLPGPPKPSATGLVPSTREISVHYIFLGDRTCSFFFFSSLSLTAGDGVRSLSAVLCRLDEGPLTCPVPVCVTSVSCFRVIFFHNSFQF